MNAPTANDALSPENASRALSRAFTKRLLDDVSAATPRTGPDSPEQQDLRWQTAQQLFAAFAPANPADAQLAAIAVAAAQASLDSFLRAAQPGLPEDLVLRLRNSALAAGRTFDSILRRMRKAQSDAAAAQRVARVMPASSPRPAAPSVHTPSAPAPSVHTPVIPAPARAAVVPAAQPAPVLPQSAFASRSRRELMQTAALLHPPTPGPAPRSLAPAPRDPRAAAPSLAAEATRRPIPPGPMPPRG